MKNIDVILLAAGYGTRLCPLTKDLPKALLEVGGKTILDRLLEKITALGRCKNIFIITNDKFYKSFEDWRAAGSSFVNIEVINDGTLFNETRLGAIGDIGLVLEKKDIRNDLLIMGSDNLFDMDLADFIKFSSERRPGSALLLFDVGDKEKAKRYGICALNDDRLKSIFCLSPISASTELKRGNVVP